MNRFLKICSMISLFSVLTVNAEEVTVSAGQGVLNSVYYNFETGEQVSVSNTNWDLAFTTSAYDATIRINGVNGIHIWEVPGSDADTYASPLDTNGMAESWVEWIDSQEDWVLGSFNMGLDGYGNGDGNYGWGAYDPKSHFVLGKRLFVIQIGDELKKIFVESMIGGTYNVRYADLDGSNEVVFEVSKEDAAGRNFVYFSFENGVVDREPAKSEWHAEFGKYVDLTPSSAGLVPYVLSGVRTNMGYRVAQVEDVDFATAAVPSEDHFIDQANQIGSDWKVLNNETFKYDVVKRVYFMQRFVYNSATQNEEPAGNIYKIAFASFGGNSTGNFVFNKEVLASSVIDFGNGSKGSFSVYPNVISRGESFDVIYGLGGFKSAEMSIVSMTGNTVGKFTLDGNSDLNTRTVSGLNLPSGVYFICISAGGKISAEKIIVE